MSTPSSRPALASPVAALHQYGQSVWLDYIRRSLIASGELEAPRGGGRPRRASPPTPRSSRRRSTAATTTRPRIEEISRDPHLAPKEVYETLAMKDIQDAADVLAAVSTSARPRATAT